MHPGEDQQNRGEVHSAGHADNEDDDQGNSAVAGIEPMISAAGARIRLKRGLSLAANAHGTVHASEIAYAMTMRITDATVAAGISRASRGHGRSRVRPSANSPTPIAYAMNTISDR